MCSSLPIKDPSPSASHRRRLATLWRRHGPSLLTAGLILAWLLLALRSLGFFCYEDDEGTFLLTALGMTQGHVLYTEIWHNYLPGLVGLVWASFRIGGVNVEAPRIMVVLFGAVTLGGTAALAAASGRRWAAPMAAALFLAAPNFVRMGRSVMGEVPANAFCVLAALAMLAYERRRRTGWLVMAGALVGVAVLCKYPTIIMLPIIGVELIALAVAERWSAKHVVGAAALMGAGVLTPILITLLLVDLPALYEQIVVTHLNASRFYGLRLERNFTLLKSYFQQNNLALLPASALGLGFWFAGKRPGAWLLAAWVGLTLSSMLVSSPLSSHHIYLVLAPMVALSAGGLLDAVALFERRPNLQTPGRLLLCLASVLTLAAAVYLAPPVIDLTIERLTPRVDDHAQDREIVRLLEQHTRKDDQVVSDYPMIVFRANRSSPPWLINTSGLRFGNADLNAELAIELGETHPPAAVVFWENKFLDGAPEYIAWVQGSYVELMSEEVTEKRAAPPKFRAVYLRPDRAP